MPARKVSVAKSYKDSNISPDVRAYLDRRMKQAKTKTIEQKKESPATTDECKKESDFVIDINDNKSLPVSDEQNSKSTRNGYIKTTGKVLLGVAFIGTCAWGLPKLYNNFSTEKLAPILGGAFQFDV